MPPELYQAFAELLDAFSCVTHGAYLSIFPSGAAMGLAVASVGVKAPITRGVFRCLSGSGP